jgi:hypothetical protein
MTGLGRNIGMVLLISQKKDQELQHPFQVPLRKRSRSIFLLLSVNHKARRGKRRSKSSYPLITRCQDKMLL